MKWNDIPKFISTEHCYSVNYGLVGYVEVIKEWGTDLYYQLQMNPEFQRGHVWTEQQQIAYVEYLFKEGPSGRDFFFNKPTWRTSETFECYDDFVCVDGLQRTTAIQRFLNNEIPIFGTFYQGFEKPLSRTAMSIRVHVNDLKLKSEVLRWYIEMNEGGTPHSEEEINKVKMLLRDIDEGSGAVALG